MNREQIERAFSKLNGLCKKRNIKGEIGVIGGAAMVLAYGSDRSTKDVDAIFEPSSLIKKAVADVAGELKLDNDWLNDAAKSFMSKQPEKNKIFQFSNLTIWVPEPEYMLAMKAISARLDSKDSTDLISLIKILNLKSSEKVFNIIEKYYPKNQIPAKTKFFVEEIFETGISESMDNFGIPLKS